jgi:hypothetical protein
MRCVEGPQGQKRALELPAQSAERRRLFLANLLLKRVGGIPEQHRHGSCDGLFYLSG